ncbi:unnamed protein product [Protopolystoma xenopodis]|uniref:Uncharacterized protein n=1 Tax=Protopolystoma xenopodis TaxID=117903 RepID=A0A3S5A6P0_9PLAT|nr:unnamed protein product [Protopolystoma xenopodis]
MIQSRSSCTHKLVSKMETAPQVNMISFYRHARNEIPVINLPTAAVNADLGIKEVVLSSMQESPFQTGCCQNRSNKPEWH